MRSRILFGLGCCLLCIAGCRCGQSTSQGLRPTDPVRCDRSPPAPPTAPLAIQADQSNCEHLPPAKVPPLVEQLPSEAWLRSCQVAPPQRVIIEVVQQATAQHQSELKSAVPSTPAPPARPLAAIAPPSAAPPPHTLPAAIAAAQPGLVAVPTPPTVQPVSMGIVIDLGAVFDWFLAPFRWVRPIVLPQPSVVTTAQPMLVGSAAALPGMALVHAQATQAVLQAAGPPALATAPPAPPQTPLQAAELNELTQQVGELRRTLDALKQAKKASNP